MTPAINKLKKAKIKHQVLQYEHDKNVAAFGDEAVKALALPAEQVFKTLIVELDSHALACAVIPVPQRLDLKAVAHHFGVKKADMAPTDKAQRATGYIVGGISPLGQKKRLPVVIDQTAATLPDMYVSGGRRGLDIRLAPADLAHVIDASFAAITKTHD